MVDLACGYRTRHDRRDHHGAEDITLDQFTEALSKYGGTVLKSSLSKDIERQIQQALHDSATTNTTNPVPA
jgi:hypothetical protein